MVTNLSTQELLDLLVALELVLIDARVPAAFNDWKLHGEERGGHIRGAVNIPLIWTTRLMGSDVGYLEEYRNIDNPMRDCHEIAAIWQENGITLDKKISFYFRMGLRSSEVFFYAYLMDWKDISIYDGGW